MAKHSDEEITNLIEAVNAAWKEEDYAYRKRQEAQDAYENAQHQLNCANTALQKACANTALQKAQAENEQDENPEIELIYNIDELYGCTLSFDGVKERVFQDLKNTDKNPNDYEIKLVQVLCTIALNKENSP
jgi:hypothetical protein